MWDRQHKLWLYLKGDIIASDRKSAVFMSDYIRHINIHKIYLNSLEVADLQRYKLISTPKKVKIAINERLSVPFVFIFCKN